MNIKVKPFVIGTLIATVLLVTINIITLFVSRNTLPTTFDPNVAPDPEMFLASGIASLVSCFCGIGSVFLGAGAYAYLHNQEKSVDVQDGMIGGGAVGAVSYLAAGIFGLLVNLLLLPSLLDTANLPAELGPEFGSIMLASSAVGGIIGLCFSLVIGGVVGAGSGALVAAVLSRD